MPTRVLLPFGLIGSLALLIVGCGGGSVPPPPPNTTMQIDIAKNVKGAPGSRVVVPITVKRCPGLGGTNVSITYSSTVVERLSISPGNLIAGFLASVKDSPGDGKIKVAAAGTVPGTAGDGNLFTLTIDIKPTAEEGTLMPITFEYAFFSDKDGNPVTNKATSNGSVLVKTGR